MYEGNFVAQDFLPENLKGKLFYNPAKNQREEQIREWLKVRWGTRYPL
jgi:putative ATPase